MTKKDAKQGNIYFGDTERDQKAYGAAKKLKARGISLSELVKNILAKIDEGTFHVDHAGQLVAAEQSGNLEQMVEEIYRMMKSGKVALTASPPAKHPNGEPVEFQVDEELMDAMRELED